MIWVKDQHAQAQQWLMHAQAWAQAQSWIMHAQPQAQAQLQRKRLISVQTCVFVGGVVSDRGVAACPCHVGATLS